MKMNYSSPEVEADMLRQDLSSLESQHKRLLAKYKWIKQELLEAQDTIRKLRRSEE